MFGWEFPPHISGGLGTASYGLTKGMSTLEDLEVIFVVPKAWGDEDQTRVRLIGANKVPVAFKQVHYKGFRHPLEMIEISSRIVPYTDPEEFWTRLNTEESGYKLIVETNTEGTVDFTGRYDGSLMDEIYKYSVVASVIAGENDFDIIHAHDWLAYPAGIAAMEVSGKPLVIHVHATDFDRSGGNVNPDVYRIEKLGMDAASKIITVSNLTRDIVINKYNINPDKVETVYNAVEPLKMSPDVVVEKGFDDKVVTFLGRITLQKGPEYFIEAAYKVLKAMPDVRFVMAGSGDMMEKMMRRAAALKITDRFQIYRLPEREGCVHNAEYERCVHNALVIEPFGISPLEAMQSNVPVIISKQSGVSEILTHAVKTDFWDIDAMADAIYGILNYPGLSKIFMQYGREEVVSLKWDNAARHVRDIY